MQSTNKVHILPTLFSSPPSLLFVHLCSCLKIDVQSRYRLKNSSPQKQIIESLLPPPGYFLIFQVGKTMGPNLNLPLWPGLGKSVNFQLQLNWQIQKIDFSDNFSPISTVKKVCFAHLDIYLKAVSLALPWWVAVLPLLHLPQRQLILFSFSKKEKK